MSANLPKRPLAFRARPQTIERLRQRARDLGETQTALAERYLEEGLSTDRHPLIAYRSGPGGRRPTVAGTRLDVAQVIETLRVNDGSIEKAAAYLELAVPKVRACVSYYAEYEAEIDGWIERARAVAAREEELWRREQSLLS